MHQYCCKNGKGVAIRVGDGQAQELLLAPVFIRHGRVTVHDTHPSPSKHMHTMTHQKNANAAVLHRSMHAGSCRAYGDLWSSQGLDFTCMGRTQTSAMPSGCALACSRRHGGVDISAAATSPHVPCAYKWPQCTAQSTWLKEGYSKYADGWPIPYICGRDKLSAIFTCIYGQARDIHRRAHTLRMCGCSPSHGV